jgi:hypothetical protein
MLDWKDVGDTVQSFVTAAGIIAGGVFTYYKFIKDRIYRPRLDLDIQAGTICVDKISYLMCSLNVHNKGSTKLSISHAGTAVIVSPGIAAEEDFKVTRWRKTESVYIDVFARHDWIESTETIHDEALLRVPADGKTAFRVQLRFVVQAPSPLTTENIAIWTTRIIPPGQRWPLTSNDTDTTPSLLPTWTRVLTGISVGAVFLSCIMFGRRAMTAAIRPHESSNKSGAPTEG